MFHNFAIFYISASQISEILKKPVEDHTPADMALLKSSPDVVKKVQRGVRTRQLMKERKEEVHLYTILLITILDFQSA